MCFLCIALTRLFADKVLFVYVSSEDIKKGIMGSPIYCPIASALQNLLELTADYVSVNPHWFTIYDKEYRRTEYTVPPSAKNFIRRFDSGKTVYPFVFIARVSESRP